jgi:hypothetical protein
MVVSIVTCSMYLYCSVDIDKLDAAAEADPTLFDVSHVPDRLLIQESGKMMFLVKLLDNLKEEGHRCLIFSSSRRMLDIVEKVMRGKVCHTVRSPVMFMLWMVYGGTVMYFAYLLCICLIVDAF